MFLSLSALAAGLDAPNALVANVTGMAVFLDPGHNGVADASLTRQVPNGRGGTKDCNTMGSATDDGYPEHAFNWDVIALTGPEVLAGFTRLTAGTAQKVVLKAFSTGVMIALGKAYGPSMVDVRATNVRLRRRAVGIVRDAAGVDEEAATAVLAAAGGHAKTTIVALLAGIDAAEASVRLDWARGRVRDALAGT